MSTHITTDTNTRAGQHRAWSWSRIPLGFLMGVGIGKVFSTIAMLHDGTENLGVNPLMLSRLGLGTALSADIIQSLVCGVLGMWFFSSAVLYRPAERVETLPVTTLLHFGGSLGLVLIAGYLCGWFALQFGVIVGTLGLFVAVYGVIWLGYYLYYRRLAKHMNAALNGAVEVRHDSVG